MGIAYSRCKDLCWYFLSSFSSARATTDSERAENYAPQTIEHASLHKLPNAVVEKIIHFAVLQDNGTTGHSAADTLLAVSHTSRRLRNMCIAEPRLWADTLQPEWNSTECFSLFLSRSRDCPLHLEVQDPGYDSTSPQMHNWRLLSRQLHRWASLQVVDFARDDEEATRHGTSVDSTIPSHPFLAHLFATFQSRHVYASPSLSYACTSMAAPFSSLTTLKFVQLEENMERKPTGAEWASLLQLFPSLESLTLVHAVQIPRYFVDIIPSTHLSPKGVPGKLRKVIFKGNLTVYAALLEKLGMKPQIFKAILYWDECPRWIQPEQHDLDVEVLRQSLASILKIFQRFRFTYWSTLIQSEQIALRGNDYRVSPPVHMGFRLVPRRSQAESLSSSVDQAFSKALLEVPLFTSVSTVKTLALDIDCTEAQWPRTFQTFSTLHSSMGVVDVIQLSSSTSAHQPVLTSLLKADDAELSRGRPRCPVPEATTLEVDGDIPLHAGAWAGVRDYLNYRFQAPGVRRIQKITVHVTSLDGLASRKEDLGLAVRSLRFGPSGRCLDVRIYYRMRDGRRKLAMHYITNHAQKYLLDPVWLV